jgi:hypothetical protein
MARPKYDIVIEAVHYLPSGTIEWVRVYERRGSAFSDCILIKRKELVERLKNGKKAYGGKRLPYLAGTFMVGEPLRLASKDGKEILVSGKATNERDYLAGVPVI